MAFCCNAGLIYISSISAQVRLVTSRSIQFCLSGSVLIKIIKLGFLSDFIRLLILCSESKKGFYQSKLENFMKLAFANPKNVTSTHTKTTGIFDLSKIKGRSIRITHVFRNYSFMIWNLDCSFIEWSLRKLPWENENVLSDGGHKICTVLPGSTYFALVYVEVSLKLPNVNKKWHY